MIGECVDVRFVYMTRDEFSESTKQNLRERVGGLCSNPECRNLTTGPHSDSKRAILVGVAAHITAASPNGPRYDRSLTVEQRRSNENGIWLCVNCARLIDTDETQYSVELLESWKHEAEKGALRELESRQLSRSRTESALGLTYTTSAGSSILMVQTFGDWAFDDRVYHVVNPPPKRRLKRLLTVYLPSKRKPTRSAILQRRENAVANILDIAPDVVALGGRGSTARWIEQQLRERGFRGGIDYWGGDVGKCAGEFLRDRGVLEDV